MASLRAVSIVCAAPSSAASNRIALVTCHYPGVVVALTHLSRLFSLPLHVGLDGFAASAAAEQAEWLVLGGWSPYYAPLCDRRRWKVAIHWHSNLGQMDADATVDLGALRQVLGRLRDGSVQRLLFTAGADAEMLRLAGFGSVGWLPDVYDLTRIPELPAVERSWRPPLVPMFMSPSSRKNLLAQLLALRVLDAELLLPPAWRESKLWPWVMELGVRHRVEALPWPHEDPSGWYGGLSAAAFGCHTSYAETFCYAAADLHALGIPCVVSPMVPLARWFDGYTRARLVVEDPTDPRAIYSALAWLHDNRCATDDLGHAAREALARANVEHCEGAHAALEGLR